MDLGGLDLNLLVALDALLSERSVTRAAQRVGLSQPGMSNALARLRRLLDDPLLVRQGATLVPTARADALIGPVHESPIELPALVETLWWHPRATADPAHAWLRARIGEVADTLISSPADAPVPQASGHS